MSQISDSSQGKGVKQYFRKSSPINVQFDWIDYFSNAGYINFYGAYAWQTTGGGYILTTQNLDTASGPTAASAGGAYGVYSRFTTGGTPYLEINFDIYIKVPMTTSPTYAFINATKALSGDTSLTKLNYTLYHVTPAGVETSIGTAESSTVSTDGPWYIRDFVQISVTEKTFGVGDRLRLEVVSNCDDDLLIYHDPASLLTFTDTKSRTIGTDLVLSMPFKVN